MRNLFVCLLHSPYRRLKVNSEKMGSINRIKVWNNNTSCSISRLFCWRMVDKQARALGQGSHSHGVMQRCIVKGWNQKEMEKKNTMPIEFSHSVIGLHMFVTLYAQHPGQTSCSAHCLYAPVTPHTTTKPKISSCICWQRENLINSAPWCCRVTRFIHLHHRLLCESAVFNSSHKKRRRDTLNAKHEHAVMYRPHTFSLFIDAAFLPDTGAAPRCI